jgi:ammonium transporter, Amt family
MNNLKKIVIIMIILIPALCIFADDTSGSKINSGDTAWVLTSSALVLLMTVPALALFYGGMVRKKNILSTIFYSLACAIIVSILWVTIQYSLIFATTPGSTDPSKMTGFAEWFGNFSKSFNGFLGNTVHPNAPTIPESVYSMFQMMFAIITVALISGAIVERMSSIGWLIFIVLWSFIVYTPLAHLVWNPEGFLWHKGALDFAGGLVVHTSSGVSALVASIYLGQRVRFRKDTIEPANISFVFIGAALLWVGWFGFNAGSAVAGNGLAGSAFVVTNTAAAVAALTWMLLELIFLKRVSVVGASTGVVAGLVAITPASGYVDITAAIIIGAVVSIISYSFMAFIRKLMKYDDALDVFSVHGLGGIWGAIATGIFANPVINSVAKGALYGNPGQLGIQLLSVLIASVIAIVGTLICLFLTDLVTGKRMRVEPQDEIYGLDLTQHGERIESK